MKILIDVGNEKPLKGDMLQFDGEKWHCVSHAATFSDERVRVAKLEEEVAELEESLEKSIEAIEGKISKIAKAVEELL